MKNFAPPKEKNNDSQGHKQTHDNLAKRRTPSLGLYNPTATVSFITGLITDITPQDKSRGYLPKKPFATKSTDPDQRPRQHTQGDFTQEQITKVL
jgi:hypothetical protein